MIILFWGCFFVGGFKGWRKGGGGGGGVPMYDGIFITVLWIFITMFITTTSRPGLCKNYNQSQSGFFLIMNEETGVYRCKGVWYQFVVCLITLPMWEMVQGVWLFRIIAHILVCVCVCVCTCVCVSYIYFCVEIVIFFFVSVASF